MKKQWLLILIHLFFWTSTSWFLISGLSITSVEVDIVDGVETQHVIRNANIAWQIFFACLMSTLVFYSHVYFLELSIEIKRKSVILSVGILVSAVGLYELISWFFVAPPLPTIQRSLLYSIFIFYYVAAITNTLGKKWLLAENQRKNLLLEKHTAELNLLRQQLHPHFLFNALNNLLSMVNQKEQPKLADSIARLASLLRFVVEETNAEKIKMSREIDFLKDYVALQQIRFEPDEVEIKWDLDGDFENILIEPGLFIPFVENAFKHGTEPEIHTIITISLIAPSDDHLVFKIENPVPNYNVTEGLGTGIQAVRNRLELVYPKKYELHISKKDSFLVQLTLQTS